MAKSRSRRTSRRRLFKFSRISENFKPSFSANPKRRRKLWSIIMNQDQHKLKNFCCHQEPEEKKSDISGEAKTEAGEMTHYTCPMHPEVIKDEPGLCLGCGMALIPKKADRKTTRNDYDISETSHKDHEMVMPAHRS